jgi:hypothetical protein
MHVCVRGAIAVALISLRVARADDASAPPSREHPLTIDEPRFSFEPFAFLRLQYIFVQDDPNVAFIGRDDGFELQNARVGVAGHLGRVYYKLAFDGATDERAQINSPQGKLTVALKDAWADVAVSGEAPWLQTSLDRVVIRGGFFQSWVEPEAQIPDTKRELVDRPIESRGMRPTEGWQTPGLTPGRSLGVAVRLDPAPRDDGVGVGFELAAQNGADEYASNNDNNYLAVSAGGIVRFPGDGWVVGALRWNPRTVGLLPFRQDETDYQASIGGHVVVGPASLGIGGIVTHTVYVTTNGPSQNAYGAHAQAMFALPVGAPVSVGYRFGILDPSTLITTGRVMEHTAAALWAMPRLHMRFQLQATHVVWVPSRQIQDDRIQLAAEFSL